MTLLDLFVLLLIKENNLDIEFADEHMNVEWAGDPRCSMVLGEYNPNDIEVNYLPVETIIADDFPVKEF